MKINYLKLGILLAVLFFSNVASAEDIGDMFKNSANTWESGITLAKGIAMLAGVIISCGAVLKLKEISDNPQRKGVSLPISLFFIGAALITISMQMDVVSSTLLLSDDTGASSIFSSGTSDTAEEAINDIIKYVFVFIIFIGNIAFIRGFFVLREVSMGNTRKTLANAFVHIIGGALAININSTVAMLAATFAPGLLS